MPQPGGPSARKLRSSLMQRPSDHGRDKSERPSSTSFHPRARELDQVLSPRSSLSGEIQLPTQLPFCPHRGGLTHSLMPGAATRASWFTRIVPARPQSPGDLQSHARESGLVSAGLRRYGLLVSCLGPIITLESSVGTLAAADSDALLGELSPASGRGPSPGLSLLFSPRSHNTIVTRRDIHPTLDDNYYTRRQNTIYHLRVR
jgi:hypothetical protein